MNLAGIGQALKDGHRIHAFLSGGGLRVVRIEKRGVLKGYGEHPQVEDALSHANEDFLAGGRSYDEVYGGSKPHYLTGSSTATSPLDQWLLEGQDFDVWQRGKRIVFQLGGWVRVRPPEEIVEKVLQTGQSATWENRGHTYRTTKSSFPNGEPCTSSQIIKSPEGKQGDSNLWMYRITKTGRGKDFFEAMNNALEADEVEV